MPRLPNDQATRALPAFDAPGNRRISPRTCGPGHAARENNQRRPPQAAEIAEGRAVSKGIEQDVAFIQALARLLKESDLAEIEVEREYGEDDELKVRLSRAPASPVHLPAQTSHAPVNATPTAHHQPAPQPAAQAAPAAEPQGPDLSNAIASPMVGTAYLSPEPGADPFVSVGDQVAEGQTLLIIEAMKTMNQIPSPRAGRVRAVLVDNAEPVEFGEPLMIVE